MTTWTKETINLSIATDSLSVDDIRIDGSYIGHASDIDLLTLSSGALLVKGTIEAEGTITGNITGNVTGTILTAAQTNITSVGTLSSLATSGNVTVGGDLTVTGNDINFGGGGKITDNNGSFTLQDTDGVSGFLLGLDTQNVNQDSTIAFLENGVVKWVIGNDGSDSDKLKIGSENASLTTNTELTLDTSGNLTTVGNVTLASDKKLYLDGGTSEALVYDSGTDTVRLYTGSAGHYTTLTTPYNENSNTVYGKEAGIGMHSGNHNCTYIGDGVAAAGTKTSAAGNNTGVGFNVFNVLTTGYQNTAVGTGACVALTEGYHNTAMGRGSLTALTTGNYNTALGWQAGYANVSDHKNVYVGRNSGASFASSGGDTSTYNTTLGAYAGEHWTTGVKNTLVGAEAGNGTGNPTTGSDNIMIGWHADPSADGTNNEIVIGTNATGIGANKAVIGNASCTDVYMAQDSGASVHCTSVTVKETTTPTALADHGKIYTKNDNKLYFQDGGGTEHEISFA